MKKYVPVVSVLLAVQLVHLNLARAESPPDDGDDVYYQPSTNTTSSSDVTVTPTDHQSKTATFFGKIFGHQKNYLQNLDDQENVIQDTKNKDYAKLKTDQAKQDTDQKEWVRETAEITAAQTEDGRTLQLLNDQKTKLDDAVTKQTAEYDRLNKLAYKKDKDSTETKNMNAALTGLTKLESQDTVTEKSITDAETRLEFYGRYQTDLKTKLAQIQPKVTTREVKLASSITTLSDLEKFDASKRAADKVLDKQKESGYDAKLLLSDFKTLETKNHMTKMEIEGLKASLNERLGNTPMGNYANEQITKVMSNLCALQAACSVKSATEINGLVNSLLGAPRGTTLDQVTSGSVKAPTSTTDVVPVKNVTGETQVQDAK